MFVTMRVVFVSSLLLAPLTAQTVWNVPAPDGMQATINAASPGDILVLTNTPGSFLRDYEPFTLDKGLTIRGNGASIGTQAFSTVYQVTIDIPPGQVAHIEQIETAMPTSPSFAASSARVVVQGGTVRFENCQLAHVDTPLTISNAEVTFAGGWAESSGTVFIGPGGFGASGHGIVATQSRLTLRDCAVRGAAASNWPTPARAGLVMSASLLLAERVSITGGGNFNPGLVSPGANGIEASGSTMWLADSGVLGGTSATGAPGTALVNTNGPTAALCQTILTPGAGGQPSIGPIDPNAPLLRLALSAGWQRGATSTLQLRGQPGAFFALGLAPDVVSTLLPQVVEPLWAIQGVPIALGVLDANGTSARPVAVPTVASLQHATVWCQALGGLQEPWRATTIAGGVIR